MSLVVGRFLLSGGLRLVLLLPLRIGHAVNTAARIFIVKLDVMLLGRGHVIFGKAVSAKTCQIHKVDILHIGARPQMCGSVRAKFQSGSWESPG